MSDQLLFPPESPEFEVWGYLDWGLDMAHAQIDDSWQAELAERPPKMGPAEREFLLQWGTLAFSGLTQLALDPQAKDEELKHVRRAYKAPGAEPWLRFAVDLRFAEEGVRRAELALERHAELMGVHLPPGLSPRSRRYVAEAVSTFLFGFDAACISFCGAAVEQELKEACLRAGLYNEKTIRHERPTGNTVLRRAKRGGLIEASYEAAEGALDRRNALLHRGVELDEDLHDEAVKHLVTLSEVFHELDEKSPRRG